MEEILHQLVGGLSRHNPIICSVSQLPVVTINITHNIYHDINIVIDIMILLIY